MTLSIAVRLAMLGKNRAMLRLRYSALLASAVVGLVLQACGLTKIDFVTPVSSTKQELVVWWAEGYFPEETDAVKLVSKKWERLTGKKVSIEFLSENELNQRAVQILQGSPKPDLLYGYGVGDSVAPTLAYKGYLVEANDIVKDYASDYIPGIIESVTFLNKRLNARNIYAVPVSANFLYIHYWKDLLDEANPNTTSIDIPQNWRQFWDFWGSNQANLKKAGFSKTKALGLPMSYSASDTNDIFNYFLEAHDVKILDQSGKLIIDEQSQRQKIINALKDYTDLYKKGWVPVHATRWSNADNNINFLSSLSLLTVNPTLSIPGSQLADSVTYEQRLRTIPWPNGVNNKAIKNMISVKQILIFDAGKVVDAKNFTRFFLKRENLALFNEGSQGRYLPVFKTILSDPFWNNPRDVHIQVAKKMLSSFRLPYQVLNPAYTTVVQENIWGRAIEDICTKNAPITTAADDATKAIVKIFKDWNN